MTLSVKKEGLELNSSSIAVSGPPIPQKKQEAIGPFDKIYTSPWGSRFKKYPVIVIFFPSNAFTESEKLGYKKDWP